MAGMRSLITLVVAFSVLQNARPRSNPEQGPKPGAPVIEYKIRLSSHEKRIDRPGQRIERQSIVHQVPHFRFLPSIHEEMLVVPESVRPEPLLVHEIPQRIHGGYFRGLTGSDKRKRRYGVRDDHAGIYFPLRSGSDPQVEFRRSNLRKIMRIGEEFPGFFQRNRQDLRAFEPIDFHGGSVSCFTLQRRNSYRKIYGPGSYVNAKTFSDNHFRKESLSWNCPNSCVSSCSKAVITRPRA